MWTEGRRRRAEFERAAVGRTGARNGQTDDHHVGQPMSPPCPEVGIMSQFNAMKVDVRWEMTVTNLRSAVDMTGRVRGRFSIIDSYSYLGLTLNIPVYVSG